MNKSLKRFLIFIFAAFLFANLSAESLFAFGGGLDNIQLTDVGTITAKYNNQTVRLNRNDINLNDLPFGQSLEMNINARWIFENHFAMGISFGADDFFSFNAGLGFALFSVDKRIMFIPIFVLGYTGYEESFEDTSISYKNFAYGIDVLLNFKTGECLGFYASVQVLGLFGDLKIEEKSDYFYNGRRYTDTASINLSGVKGFNPKFRIGMSVLLS